MRYLFLILTLFCFSVLKAQTIPQVNTVPWYQFLNKLTAKGRLQIPADTFASATVLDTSSLANKNGTLYLYDTVGGVLGWHPATISPALLDSIRGTGVFSGSGVAINGGDNTKFDIDVSGVIKDPLSGTAVYITKTATAQTVTNLASQNVTYISVNASGTIIQQSTPWTPEQRFTQLTGFVLVHSNRTNLNAVNNLFAVGYNGINQLQSFMDVFGMMNVSGNVFSGSVSNLSINKTAGNVHRVGANETAVSQSPNRKSLGALTAATFRYRLQTGAESVDTGFINPNVYDNGGNLTAVPTNKWTVQHIAIFVSNLVRIQRGQTVYDSKEAALLGIQNNHFAYETNIAENGLIRAYLVVQQGTTNFSDANDYAFLESSKFGFSTGGGAGGVVDTTVIASKNYVQANFWNLAGNGLTATGTMGTTSNFPVRFITNNAEVFALSTGQILTKTDASGTNQTGTDLHQGAGLGTGNAAGGAWRWYKSTPVASGTGQHTRTENGGMSSGGRYILGAATSTDNTVDMLQVTGQGSFSSEVVRVNALADTLATKAYARSVGGGGGGDSSFVLLTADTIRQGTMANLVTTDSLLAFGTSLSSPRSPADITKGYAQLTAAYMRMLYKVDSFPNYALQHTATSGVSDFYTVHTTSIKPRTAAAKYAMFEFGINDAFYQENNPAYGFDTTIYKTQYLAVLAYAVSKGWTYPEMIIVSPPYHEGTAVLMQTNYFNCTKRMADSLGCIFVDLFNTGQAFYIGTDGTHPSNYGHQKWANTIIQKLNSINPVKLNGQRLAVDGVAEFKRAYIRQTDTANVNANLMTIDPDGLVTKMPQDAFLKFNKVFPSILQNGHIYYEGKFKNTQTVETTSGFRAIGGTTDFTTGEGMHMAYLSGNGYLYPRNYTAGTSGNTIFPFGKIYHGSVTFSAFPDESIVSTGGFGGTYGVFNGAPNFTNTTFGLTVGTFSNCGFIASYGTTGGYKPTALNPIANASGGVLVGTTTYNSYMFEVAGSTYLNGSINHKVTTGISAASNYAMTATDYYIELPDLAGQANRIVTLPAGGHGRTLIIKNKNSDGTNTWSFNTPVKDNADADVSALANDKVYSLIWNGTSWIITNLY